MFTKIIQIDEMLNLIRESLISINNPRFYETERGYQGELSAELRSKLSSLEQDDAIVEQEYQKRIKSHGFKIRPDIIVHIPFDQSVFNSREEGNFLVIELKYQATKKEAIADYNKLSSMCEILGYPLGVFININSNETFFDSFKGKMKNKLYSFSVHLENNKVIVIE